MFSLRFSGSKFLINLRRQFRVRKTFDTQVFAEFAAFHFVFKFTISIMHSVLGRYLIKTCSLTGR